MVISSSEKWGVDWRAGKYPTKIYTIDGVLIYQQDEGRDNTAKVPLGGVIATGSNASSVIEAIANPITFYYGSGAVINQAGHSGDLYNYYWTSYSRGTDGRVAEGVSESKWHSAYLDGYIPLRAKSIYDPCPYLYRLPSNGTYNQFEFNQGWTQNSYLGGVSWNSNTLGKSWTSSLGLRNGLTSAFDWAGRSGFYRSSTASSQVCGYELELWSGRSIYPNRNDVGRSYTTSVRCIEGSLRLAFFSTVVEKNALGVRPILFVSKKYAKNVLTLLL